jgi:hypothetical protein
LLLLRAPGPALEPDSPPAAAWPLLLATLRAAAAAEAAGDEPPASGLLLGDRGGRLLLLLARNPRGPPPAHPHRHGHGDSCRLLCNMGEVCMPMLRFVMLAWVSTTRVTGRVCHHVPLYTAPMAMHRSYTACPVAFREEWVKHLPHMDSLPPDSAVPHSPGDPTRFFATAPRGPRPPPNPLPPAAPLPPPRPPLTPGVPGLALPTLKEADRGDTGPDPLLALYSSTR